MMSDDRLSVFDQQISEGRHEHQGGRIPSLGSHLLGRERIKPVDEFSLLEIMS